MLDSFLQGAPALLASEKSFVDADLLYVSGGLLIVFALAVSFYGMRREEGFPSTNGLRAMMGITGLLVVLTAFGAVQNSRFEQSERRAENEEASQEADKTTQEEQDAEAGQGEGEAASPAPAPDAGGSANVDAEGEQIFTSTGCGSCHTLAAAGSGGQIGPVLDDVLPGQSANAIRTSIIDPADSLSEGFGAQMPEDYSNVLDEMQLDTLVQYLQNNAGA